MIKKVWVGMWLPEGRLDMKADKLAEVGINADVKKKLEDAVDEMVGSSE